MGFCRINCDKSFPNGLNEVWAKKSQQITNILTGIRVESYHLCDWGDFLCCSKLEQCLVILVRSDFPMARSDSPSYRMKDLKFSKMN